MSSLLETVRREFERHKKVSDGALSQLADAAFFAVPAAPAGDATAPVVNSPALIVKHLAGNLKSRWSDFLTSDGDKPGRDRDREFRLEPADSREQLMAAWELGWSTLFATLDSLTAEDLSKTVTIRGEIHRVEEALIRGLTHAAYHAGQIAYLSRLLNPEGAWQTIPPGQSKTFRRPYLGKDATRP